MSYDKREYNRLYNQTYYPSTRRENRRRHAEGGLPKRLCLQCGRWFTPESKFVRYCDTYCRRDALATDGAWAYRNNYGDLID